ncbi:hypothetical protein [Streptoalloteichus hindustanus]|uniref:Tetratricopeptide repeat-containing protein n=1 Tax=Streptoalloteichus hindustanus TaxID=2017 RepID=A0A1M4UZG6_STRHI|nr:hypothetical protein [Streptoalloteichus hindustanus]SHE62072.1 hypothetical protein SAMN05444320_101589 [Streptoalloteichus hindustanus]
MDPNNPVIRLCVEGMQAEAEGRDADALALFQQAWDTATDDYEACVAAHYVARHQPTPELTLHWNRECLRLADLVADDRVSGFHASLHLNMGKAHQNLDEPEKAREHFVAAAEHVSAAPAGQYGDWIRFAVAEGLRATGTGTRRPADGPLPDLLAKLCARADLRALGLILPAYLGDLGTDDDQVRLSTALRMVHASRWLPDDEQAVLSEAISTLPGTKPPAGV